MAWLLLGKDFIRGQIGQVITREGLPYGARTAGAVVGKDFIRGYNSQCIIILF